MHSLELVLHVFPSKFASLAQVHFYDYPSDSKAILEVIKSPQYTRGDFMFLYRFVRRSRRHPQPQSLVHVITFEQLFRFLSFLVGLIDLTYRLRD